MGKWQAPPTWLSLCQLRKGPAIPLPQLDYSCMHIDPELQKYLSFLAELNFSVNLTSFDLCLDI